MRRLYEIFFFMVPLIVVVLFVMMLQFEEGMSKSFLLTVQITLGVLTLISLVVYGYLVRERIKQILPETKEVTQKELLSAIDQAEVGYAILGMDGEIIYCSSSAHELLSPSPKTNIIGKIWYEIDGDTPRIVATRKEIWERYIRERRSWQGIIHWLTGTGEKKYYDCTASFLDNNRTVLVITDRTDRVNALRDLTVKERTHNYILDNIPMAISLQNIDGTIEYSNEFLPSRLGIKAQDLIGQLPRDLPETVPLKELTQVFEQVKSTEQPIEAWPLAVDRGILKGTQWLIYLYPVFDRNNQMDKILAVSFDHTEIVKLSKERELFARKLFETQKIEAMNKFAGGLAHELSNLLHPAGVYARALSDNPNHTDREKLLTHINDAVLTSGAILRETLAMSKPQTEAPKPVDLKIILKQIIDNATDIAPKGLAYNYTVPPKEIIALVGDTELRQVVLNLLVNAADAQDGKGTIKITLSTKAAAPADFATLPTRAGPFACIAVQDNGIGMDSDTKQRIFEPFFTTKTKDKGTGLGLAVVQGLVTGWGGSVTVDSELGKGSTFKVLLPLAGQNDGIMRRET